MFEARELALAGCFELSPIVRSDDRGRFVKTVHGSQFARLGLRADFVEQYHSTSRKDVLRGLHYQAPPAAHAKLVTCLVGRVFDAAVDLRPGSTTFGQAVHLVLEADKANLVYLPIGVAHGFWTLSAEAILLYNVTSEYAAASDAGVLWSSVDIPWPGTQPILSERDSLFPALGDLDTPF